MPWGDRSGPAGMGPRTGRGAGFCGGYDRPGAADWSGGPGGFGGRGRGGGFGGGRRGSRHWFHATGLPGWARGAAWGAMPFAPESPVSEQESLKRQGDALQTQLDAVKKRLDEIGSDTTAE